MRSSYDPVPKYDIGAILEHLGAELPYSRRGGWQKMRCFLHSDQNPSASVNFLRGYYRCFSCGIFEDGIGLIQHVEGSDFKAAREEAERVSPEGNGSVRKPGGRSRTLFGE